MNSDILANIFVYGTLMQRYNGYKPIQMDKLGTFLGTTHIQGKLYEIDNYPGLVKSNIPTDFVNGEVYSLFNPTDSLYLLDTYEMCTPNDPEPHEYKREIISLTVNNRKLTAWVYYYNHTVDESKRIVSGNYSI